MSEEQLKAAKFDIVTQYQGLKARSTVLESKIRALGEALKHFGEDLSRSGRPLRHGNGKPDFEALSALLAEQVEVDSAFDQARTALKGIGIDPL